jgi:chaperonin GroES
MTLKPLHDRVVVRRIDADTTSKGGIIIPGTAAEKPNEGEVVAVGPGTVLESGETRALTVAVGDRVLFGKYAPTEITLDGDELLVIRESDILAIIDNTTSLEKAA